MTTITKIITIITIVIIQMLSRCQPCPTGLNFGEPTRTGVLVCTPK